MSYTMYTPLNVWLDPASVTDVVAYIQNYLSENTIYSEEEIETLIHDYLEAHPELIGGVQSVNGKTGTVVLTASDINTANNVTIESVLASLSSQISSIASSVATNTSNITNLTGRVTTAETDISNLKSNLEASYNAYQIIEFDVTENVYVDRTNGTIKPYNGWDAIEYISVIPDRVYYFDSQFTSSYSALYDENKVFLSAVSIQTGNPFALKIQSNAHYLSISNERGKLPNRIYIDSAFVQRLLTITNNNNWVNGSISNSGVDLNDSISIRSVTPWYYNDDIKIVFLNDLYRVRFYQYNSSGEFISLSSWITKSDYQNNPYRINREFLYRIQISLINTSGVIDLDDALNNVKFIQSYSTLSFWNTYIKDKTNIVNTYLANGNNKSVFLFLTDTHWNDNPAYLNHYGINPTLMHYLAEKCNINTIIHGGDFNSENRSDKSIAITNMTDPVAKMRSVFDYVFLTRGNHDDNIEGANNWSYVITQSDSYSYMFRGTKDVVFGESGTYFYHDIPHEKLRIISLDCVDFPYENSVDASKSDLKILAYGFAQLQWLCDTLKNTPDGYHIVIYTHAMLAPSVVTVDHPASSPQTRALNYLTVCDLLKAYKTRANFTASMDGSFVSVHKDYYTGNLSGDFTSCNASIVGVFSGHEHVDCIEEILDSNGNGIGIYNTCTQNSSALFSSDIISSTYQHPMEIGTTTELVWDVVVIDRDAKAVRMIRIGANGANTDVAEVNVRSFDYN